MGRVFARMGRRGVHDILVGNSEGNGPLGRIRRRLQDNMGMDLRETK
jgi:hypothetical protein